MIYSHAGFGDGNKISASLVMLDPALETYR